MLRGRMGGTGAPFNMGEMTVTRCALKLATGEVGHAYVQGRDKAHAERAALVDALMQTGRADTLRAQLLAPLEAEAQAGKTSRAARARNPGASPLTRVASSSRDSQPSTSV